MYMPCQLSMFGGVVAGYRAGHVYVPNYTKPAGYLLRHTIKQLVIWDDNQGVHRYPECFNGLCSLNLQQELSAGHWCFMPLRQWKMYHIWESVTMTSLLTADIEPNTRACCDCPGPVTVVNAQRMANRTSP